MAMRRADLTPATSALRSESQADLIFHASMLSSSYLCYVHGPTGPRAHGRISVCHEPGPGTGTGTGQNELNG